MRRTRIWGPVAAVTVLWVFTAVIPIWMYVDARAVPDGVTTQTATVVGYEPSSGTARARRTGGEIARVELPDGTVTTVYLARRTFLPDEGDEVEVWDDDGDLRATSERSGGGVALALLALVGWPAATIMWLRSRRPGRGRGPAEPR